MKYRCFATCPKGLESILVEELNAVGAQDIVSTLGGVFFSGQTQTLYSANLESRTATRIFMEVKSGFYKTENDIYHLAKSVTWEYFFDLKQTFRISTHAIHCPLKSLNFITLKVKDAVADRFRQKKGARPNVQSVDADIHIYCFLEKQRATLYLDSSGAPLFARGFRQKSVLAPVKENLAAGILKLLNWQPQEALFDPLCGSGTFLLEACLMAYNMAPGQNRHFAFENFRHFQSDLWLSLKETAQKRVRAVEKLHIYGSDSDAKVLAIARSNLQHAGFSIPLQKADIVNTHKPENEGLLIANPPYGERLSEWDDDFHHRLSSTLKKQWSGWRCAFLSADLNFPKRLRLKPSRKIALFNGALDCRVFLFPMVSGSNR